MKKIRAIFLILSIVATITVVERLLGAKISANIVNDSANQNYVDRTSTLALVHESKKSATIKSNFTFDLLGLKYNANVPLNYHVHAFYYAWYGAPAIDGDYLHWNHKYLPHWNKEISKKYPTGERHIPPNDISSVYYPHLGPYSSRDEDVIEYHMLQLIEAGVGVFTLSWYPPGMADDEGKPFHAFVFDFLDIAHKYNVKVCIHMEPFKANTSTILAALDYINLRYGNHPAFYKKTLSDGRKLPLVYFYDTYLLPNELWKSILSPNGIHTIRGKFNDVLAIGLVVEKKHMYDLRDNSFDGMYTYFAADKFSFGSTQSNWKEMAQFCKTFKMMFVPSVGPGYDDTKIRPWNGQNKHDRENGKYYERSWGSAVNDNIPPLVTITSFNEWQEGTQIEAISYKKTGYLQYPNQDPLYFIHLTKSWSSIYSSKLRTIKK